MNMTLEQARDKLAIALERAVSEHGIPNRFRAIELHQKYGGPSTLLMGRIGKNYIVSLWQAMGGHNKFPTCPVYNKGWFIL